MGKLFLILFALVCLPVKATEPTSPKPATQVTETDKKDDGQTDTTKDGKKKKRKHDPSAGSGDGVGVSTENEKQAK